MEPDKSGALHPDYLGVVCGAEYKLDDEIEVQEYALIAAGGGKVLVLAASDGDLRALAKQIIGLVGE